MFLDLACEPRPDQLAVVEELDSVVRSLDALGERILEVTVEARAIATLTDWRSQAATAFHERAEEWAGDVSGLHCLTESARVFAARARDHVVFAASGGC